MNKHKYSTKKSKKSKKYLKKKGRKYTRKGKKVKSGGSDGSNESWVNPDDILKFIKDGYANIPSGYNVFHADANNPAIPRRGLEFGAHNSIWVTSENEVKLYMQSLQKESIILADKIFCEESSKYLFKLPFKKEIRLLDLSDIKNIERLISENKDLEDDINYAFPIKTDLDGNKYVLRVSNIERDYDLLVKLCDKENIDGFIYIPKNKELAKSMNMPSHHNEILLCNMYDAFDPIDKLQSNIEKKLNEIIKVDAPVMYKLPDSDEFIIPENSLFFKCLKPGIPNRKREYYPEILYTEKCVGSDTGDYRLGYLYNDEKNTENNMNNKLFFKFKGIDSVLTKNNTKLKILRIKEPIIEFENEQLIGEFILTEERKKELIKDNIDGVVMNIPKLDDGWPVGCDALYIFDTNKLSTDVDTLKDVKNLDEILDSLPYYISDQPYKILLQSPTNYLLTNFKNKAEFSINPKIYYENFFKSWPERKSISKIDLKWGTGTGVDGIELTNLKSIIL